MRRKVRLEIRQRVPVCSSVRLPPRNNCAIEQVRKNLLPEPAQLQQVNYFAEAMVAGNLRGNVVTVVQALQQNVLEEFAHYSIKRQTIRRSALENGGGGGGNLHDSQWGFENRVAALANVAGNVNAFTHSHSC